MYLIYSNYFQVWKLQVPQNCLGYMVIGINLDGRVSYFQAYASMFIRVHQSPIQVTNTWLALLGTPYMGSNTLDASTLWLTSEHQVLPVCICNTFTKPIYVQI